MGLLKDLGAASRGLSNVAGGGIQGTGQTRPYQDDGFVAVNMPAGDNNSLPQTSIKPGRPTKPTLYRRDLIKWFVPEVGIVNMYINPQSMRISYKKAVSEPERTKGGYIVSYWGEDLPRISIQGHTGSSGIEGINVLHQIYRSEQYTFDPIALSMAADASLSGLGDLVSKTGNIIGGAGGGLVASAANSVFGMNPLTQTLMPRNPPTLSALALGIEMYYSGIVYRGYFTNMEVDESVDKMGIFNYNISFVATQTRGYRLNQFAFSRDPSSGPSDNSTTSGVPLSYKY